MTGVLNGRYLRGLTLWRPWPWTFTHAGKRCENRPWKPPPTIIGGYVALHAGLKFDKEAAKDMAGGLFAPAAKAVPLDPSEHPASVIVAVAQVEGWHYHGNEDLVGYEFGPYVWELPKVTVLERPVPCKGAQGLWRLPDDVFEAVVRQVAP